jgi:hypothetical protein
MSGEGRARRGSESGGCDPPGAGRRERRVRSGSRQLSNPDELRLPDPSGLEPIEGHLWSPGGVVPYETTEIIRGSPLTAAKFLEHAVRQARRYSYAGQNMVSVSVNLVLPDWPAERILEERLSTYPRWGRSSVSVLTEAGFTFLATGERPHADLVFPDLGILWAEKLAALFGPSEQKNEFLRR